MKGSKEGILRVLDHYFPRLLYIALLGTLLNLAVSSSSSNSPTTNKSEGQTTIQVMNSDVAVEESESVAGIELEVISGDHHTYPEVVTATQTALAGFQRGGKLFCEIEDTEPSFQVMFARLNGTESRLEERRTHINRALLEMAGTFSESAQNSGGQMIPKVQMAEDCWPEILEIEVPRASLTSTAGIRNELHGQGFSSNDRKYLVYVDGRDIFLPYCGESTLQNDSDAGQENRNNTRLSRIVIAAVCWDGASVAHEGSHALGGVQHDAPNATGGWHGIDENDLLSYSDYPNYPPTRLDCPDPYAANLLDCNHNDFLNAHPAPGSYLATHWNIYNSSFVWNPGETGEPPIPPVSYVELSDPHKVVIYPKEQISLSIPFSLTAGTLAYGLDVFLDETLIHTFTGEEIMARPQNEPLLFGWQVPEDMPFQEVYFSGIARFLTHDDSRPVSVRLMGVNVHVMPAPKYSIFLPTVIK
jgi:hypothetical protein